MKVIFLLAMIFSLETQAQDNQCHFRLINKTDSNISVNFTRLKLNINVAPKDTSLYFSIDSLQNHEDYIITVGKDRFIMRYTHSTNYEFYNSGFWQMTFAYNYKRDTWVNSFSEVKSK